MADYYCCYLDLEDHIQARELMDASSDREAMDRAKKYLDTHPTLRGIEIWLGERQVTKLQQAASVHFFRP